MKTYKKSFALFLALLLVFNFFVFSGSALYDDSYKIKLTDTIAIENASDGSL